MPPPAPTLPPVGEALRARRIVLAVETWADTSTADTWRALREHLLQVR